MEVLLRLDQQVFLFINHWGHQLFGDEMNFVIPFLDGLMLFFSKIGSVAAVWFVLGLVFAFLEKKKGLKSVIAFLWPLFLAIALSYILVNLTLKPLIGRMRPNFVIPQTILLGSVHYDFSFPSGHTTSSFAAAFVLVKKFKVKARVINLGPIWPCFVMCLAVLISFSRIYIGVHYPLDVLAGMVLGAMIGKISVWVDGRVAK